MDLLKKDPNMFKPLAAQDEPLNGGVSQSNDTETGSTPSRMKNKGSVTSLGLPANKGNQSPKITKT